MFRGKKYQESAKQIDKAMLYDPKEGLELICKTAYFLSLSLGSLNALVLEEGSQNALKQCLTGTRITT